MHSNNYHNHDELDHDDTHHHHHHINNYHETIIHHHHPSTANHHHYNIIALLGQQRTYGPPCNIVHSLPMSMLPHKQWGDTTTTPTP